MSDREDRLRCLRVFIFLPSVRSHYHSLSCCFQVKLPCLCTLANYEKTKAAAAVHSLSSFSCLAASSHCCWCLQGHLSVVCFVFIFFFFSVSVSSDGFYISKPQLKIFLKIHSASLRIVHSHSFQTEGRIKLSF